MLITLIAAFLSFVIDIDCEIRNFFVSVKFSKGFAVPVVLLFDGRSTNAVIVFLSLIVLLGRRQ